MSAVRSVGDGSLQSGGGVGDLYGEHPGMFS